MKAQFVIGRIVTGVGNGMNTSSIPTYQAECAKTKNRGLLICIEGGSIAFGTRKLRPSPLEATMDNMLICLACSNQLLA